MSKIWRRTALIAACGFLQLTAMDDANNDMVIELPGGERMRLRDQRELMRLYDFRSTFLMGFAAGFVEGSALLLRERGLVGESQAMDEIISLMKAFAMAMGPASRMRNGDHLGAPFVILPLAFGLTLGYHTGCLTGASLFASTEDVLF